MTLINLAIAVTPIIISSAVAFIGFLQYRTNRHKFKLDLYNRRFAVYDKALSYFQAYYSQEQGTVASCAKEFIRFYRESIFLFGLHSEVYKVLTELKDTLSFLAQFEEKFSSKPYDKDEYEAWSKTKEKKRDLDTIMKALEEALMPWLDFKKILK